MRRPGILIVTYNSSSVIAACLDAAVPRAGSVLVVDNASRDGTLREVRRFPGVRWIANQTNRGFAGAVNQGIAAMQAELILLLNPDVELLSDLDQLVEAFDDPRLAAAAGKLVGWDGTPQAGFSLRRFPTPAALAFEALGVNRLWPRNPVNRRYRCLDLDLDQPAEVEQPAGAFLMLRRRTWQQLEGFDEDFYPLWFEEVDFLRRARQRGYRIRYVPAAVARHRGGDSVRQLSFGCRQLYWYGSVLKYASKHFGPLDRRLVGAAVVVGSLPRVVLEMRVARSLNPLVTFAKLVRFVLAFLLSGRVRGAGRFAANTAG